MAEVKSQPTSGKQGKKEKMVGQGDLTSHGLNEGAGGGEYGGGGGGGGVGVERLKRELSCFAHRKTLSASRSTGPRT